MNKKIIIFFFRLIPTIKWTKVIPFSRMRARDTKRVLPSDASSFIACTPLLQRPVKHRSLKPWKNDPNIFAVNLLISAQFQINTLGGSLGITVLIA